MIKEKRIMNIINNTDYYINVDEIKEYISYMQQNMDNNLDFSIVFIDNNIMQNYNLEFRNKDYPTDVLTFCEEDDNYLGDILINKDKIIEQAQEYHHSQRREMYFLITHGFLHLLGYDHQNKQDATQMFNLQEQLLTNYNIRREE